ncbi:unnamed protein product [Amoebophrya sp. A120]|nr:unnamed protein product [Amoebophrya sp. A120]|eukprot:GSA120T00010539001.1
MAQPPPALAADYQQDGPEAKRIAATIPYYPFHGVPRFYDISGMLADPTVFQLCIDVFVQRYAASSKQEIDCIFGLDARGFVLGPSIALALKKPFIMLRKKGKLPNAITGAEYQKEYKSVDNAATGTDELCMPKMAFDFWTNQKEAASSGAAEDGAATSMSTTSDKPRALIIDDLVATGGTLLAACDLVSTAGAEIVECACIVELKALRGYEKLQAKHPGVKVWALISEEILTREG